VLDAVLLLCALALLVPLAALTVECLAALLPAQRNASAPAGDRPACAVLVPAHDEESGLPATLDGLRRQLRPEDRLVVVADNCTDRTAEVARAAGAEVVERHDSERRGKGFALAAGVDALRAGPPDVVVVIDADCRAADGCLDRLVAEATATGRPVQAAYTLEPPPGGRVRVQLSAYAFRFKNVIRPLGLRRLGLPCLLTGSGMAFPWAVVRNAPLASGNIVEDMRLGIDLALAGFPPRFLPLAEIAGDLPTGPRAARDQRQRWEHGHLKTLFTQVPRLLSASVRQRRPDLAALAAELSVPPLSVLGLLWAITVTAAAIGWQLGGWELPLVLLLVGGGVTMTAALLAWAKFGRTVLPPTALLAAPWYVLAKLPIYLAFLRRPQRAWVRTPRDTPAQPDDSRSGTSPPAAEVNP
jgi:cellulose synthase/poly-beta-1,6-N-acetylglucosamine synthase-like glycosyltransferase